MRRRYRDDFKGREGDPTAFRWKRKRDGYKIESEEEAGKLEHFLVEKATTQNQEPEWYFPGHEHPGLFREAADLDLSPESVIAFMNRWGLLGGEYEGILQKLGQVAALYHGWPLKELKWSVSAWNACRSNSKAKVQAFFRRDSQGEWVLTALTGSWKHRWPVDELGYDVVDEEAAIDAKHGRFREALERYLLDVTNHWLSDSVGPEIRRTNVGRFELRFAPRDLMGFLWVQFAEAIAGHKDYRPCSSCNRWMEISPDHGRPEKTYCSAACKQRVYRTRLKAATHTKRRVRQS